MNIEVYAEKYELLEKLETEKVAYLAYYQLVMHGKKEFIIDEVLDWFAILHYSQPNKARLSRKLKMSDAFFTIDGAKKFGIHARRIKLFSLEIKDFKTIVTEPSSDGSILPDSMLKGKRDYLQRFGKQINSTYTHGVYDGCAVLMRRMVEVCLIHAYENNSIDAQIKGRDGGYKDLKDIIKDAIENPKLNLTKASRSCLDEYRVLGNLSAHQLYYNCRVEEINKIKQSFRLCIEELFNKAGNNVEK